mmetsp:Transcript_43243/g.91955  ORF Transcript_43243/g.91955 Transcript_43243/m.91955 type:complete len:248 (-) Transcript_43243:134-877(-)|eukprot:CAMPEP_0172526324 /NCGR_PEP_ID=MMETSP1067-20121228/1263_1 /TAXON_ID=265564 ORGANISM="Thalassiosira punctigera, Strain Tpunct2005C2" /NCGR_SAMPLE_ID=MMETSP1067 /ASSEMBLY_ACC=CAM_ASM_000444 /LENGTH=247 /DNA_ID=CAMNT_0013309807 /DNA_START=87 /DNA_END=830 /DNA_ORIENTATION=-
MASGKLVSVAVLAVLVASAHAFSPFSSQFTPLPSSASSLPATVVDDDTVRTSPISRRTAIHCLTGLTISPLLLPALPASARLEGVNKPELLPTEAGLNVIQVEKFLTKGQEKRMNDLLTKLEADTGYRVRVLCQAYPRTPGLAIRDYWDLGKEGAKDDKFVVLVVDEFGGKGNVLNFNVGEGVKFALPNVFWTRLTSKYGTTFFVRENGIDLAITNAIEAIVSCLRSEDQYCVSVPEQGMSMKTLGL